MPLVSAALLLEQAKKDNACVGAFNIENIDMAKAVIQAAEEMKMPAIIQTTFTTVNYLGEKVLRAAVKALAQSSPAMLALHLDHGDSYDICLRCLKAGYNSVMIDASAYPLEQNIALTKRVCQEAEKYGAAVEGEIGRVGGVEDELISCGNYTVPEECLEYAQKSGVDFVAVSIGTSHGIYKGVPKINFEVLERIKSLVDIPLVLHGASWLSQDTIRECIKKGINKINFATELRQAYTQGVRSCLEDQKVYDPKIYQREGGQRVKETVMQKMKILSF